MIHRGQIVEKIVRKSGYTFTTLAAKLRISRNTLYNKFNNANLSYRFIAEIGSMIHYDFTLDIPEMKQAIATGGEHDVPSLKPPNRSAELWRIESKYTNLLEKYNKLVAILLKIVNQNEIQDIKNDLMNFIDEDKYDANKTT